MIAELEAKRDDIAAICREFGVRRLEVFGSAATGGWDAACSDIDLLVTYPEGWDFGPWMARHLELQERLAELLGCPVDLVIAREHFRNPFFEDEVRRARQTIYVAEGAT